MLGLERHLRPAGGRVDLSLRHPDVFRFPAGGGVANGTFVHFGDDTCGPVIFFFAIAPGVELPESAAHGHASDNWRISMRGVLRMGPDHYGPGEFRFQQGWKPYGSDSLSCGPDGGWSALMFADRRGTRIRPVRQDSAFADEREITEWARLQGDQVSDDPAAGAGPAGLVTTLGPVRGAHLNGSLADAGSWPELAPGVHAFGALLGDAERGPLMVLVGAEAGRCVTPASTVGTEVVRLVVDGWCTVGDRQYQAGDFHVSEAGAPVDAVVAGPAGVREVVIFGDRRHAVQPGASDAWAAGVTRLRDELSDALGAGTGEHALR